MKLIATKLADLFLIAPKKYKDDRGYFLESYKRDFLCEQGINIDFIQDNLSYSTKNVLRGLHLQKSPYAQTKLVRCLQGNIFDVAIDLRPSSPSFGAWVGYNLNDDNCYALLIPQGFAHGFYVTSDYALVAYKVDNPYQPQHELTVIYNDPKINIAWPGENFIISDKDKQGMCLDDILTS